MDDAGLWQWFYGQWQFIVFVLSALVAFFVGKERQRWNYDKLHNDLMKMSGRLDVMEAQYHADRVETARRTEQIEQMRASLARQDVKMDRILERLDRLPHR